MRTLPAIADFEDGGPKAKFCGWTVKDPERMQKQIFRRAFRKEQS